LNLEPRTAKSDLPVVASYCATFLKPEMLHIYRQITSLRRVRPIVLAQKREEAERFPFQDLYLVRTPKSRFLRRIWFRQIVRRPWRIPRSEVRALREILKTNNARLLHIYFGHIATLLRPLIEQGPALVSFHGADIGVDLEKPAYRSATVEMLGAVRGVLVRSESLRAGLIELGCSPEKIQIQRTGIPLEEFPFRERSSPRDGAWNLLQAGRLIEKKGVETSLRAFARFRQAFPVATFTIAGEGPLLEPMRQLTRELKIENAVQFSGFVSQEQLRALFYASHLFLHPSETGRDGNQEGVPNAILEAMATGLPVFATLHGGIPEAVENGVSGILVEERDYESLGKALITAVKSPDQLSLLGRAAAENVAKNFDQREQTRRLEEIYLREIARR